MQTPTRICKIELLSYKSTTSKLGSNLQGVMRKKSGAMNLPGGSRRTLFSNVFGRTRWDVWTKNRWRFLEFENETPRSCGAQPIRLVQFSQQSIWGKERKETRRKAHLKQILVRSIFWKCGPGSEYCLRCLGEHLKQHLNLSAFCHF